MGAQRALAVITALKTVFAAALTAEEVVVAKGWEILSGADQELVFVGGDGEAESEFEDVIRSAIEWPGPGPNSRTEDGEVVCAVRVWTGDPVAIDETLTRAYDILGLCEDALRVNPALFEPIALQAKITESRLGRVTQDGEGLAVLVPFTVAYMSSV